MHVLHGDIESVLTLHIGAVWFLAEEVFIEADREREISVSAYFLNTANLEAELTDAHERIRLLLRWRILFLEVRCRCCISPTISMVHGSVGSEE